MGAVSIKEKMDREVDEVKPGRTASATSWKPRYYSDYVRKDNIKVWTGGKGFEVHVLLLPKGKGR